MGNNLNNYQLLAEHVYDSLKYNFGKYFIKIEEHNYIVVKNEKFSYRAEEIDPKNLVNLRDFTNDLVKHLSDNTPLTLSMDKNAKFEDFERKNFFEKLLKIFYYKKYKLSFNLQPKEFKKLLELFKCMANNESIYTFFPSTTNCSIYSNRH